jgi:hypothetical protein
MDTCRLCCQDGIRDWLDFGPQAIRNRFLRSAEEHEYRHPLKLGVCRLCGTVQLASPPPVAELRPRFDWITYNEPERHLDDLVERLAALPGLTPGSTCAGLSYKDDSTLTRLRNRGFLQTWRPDPAVDLGISDRCSGIESIQDRMTPETAVALGQKYARPDLLIVRHVLEHTQDTHAALEWARTLVRPGGYIVFEVPDSFRALDRLDYTTVWEEHVLYFTARTLTRCLESHGFEVVHRHSYPYSLENSLVVVARAEVSHVRSALRLEFGEVACADRFVRSFPRARNRALQQLESFGRIAMLGAGHLTGAFINLFGLSRRIEFVCDDNPNKQGLLMPGSRLPVVPTSALLANDIDLCLMTVRPEVEESVIARNAAFAARGVLASVFPDSPYALAARARFEDRLEAVA